MALMSLCLRILTEMVRMKLMVMGMAMEMEMEGVRKMMRMACDHLIHLESQDLYHGPQKLGEYIFNGERALK